MDKEMRKIGYLIDFGQNLGERAIIAKIKNKLPKPKKTKKIDGKISLREEENRNGFNECLKQVNQILNKFN